MRFTIYSNTNLHPEIAMIEKCKYYNNAKSASSLMIDDLVPAAVSNDGNVSPKNDWGFLMDKESSLYKYFQNQILNKYPEIKGTIFLPLTSQEYIPIDKGYTIYKRDVDDPEFVTFLERISTRFEIAFHGNKHEFRTEEEMSIHECAAINLAQTDELISVVSNFTVKTKIYFTGGKFPGYKFNDTALRIIKKIQGKWWALSVNMINKVTPENALTYNEHLNIVLIPTNISGDIFYNYFSSKPIGVKQMIKNLIRFLFARVNKFSDPVKYLNYLYNKQLPLIVQEHFQNQKTNGKRQTPNVYDDIWSLDLIYAFMKGKDIWYATCGEIAYYYESYIHSTINIIDDLHFSIEYDGIYDIPLLSIKSLSPKIINIDTGEEHQGIYKDNFWIFNNIGTGTYKVYENGMSDY